MLIVASVALVIGAVFAVKTDAEQGRSIVPAGVDEEAASERTHQLMETDGLKWKQAWRQAIAELSDTESELSTVDS